MAIFQASSGKYLVIFLALAVTFNGSLLTHGRQIKPILNQHSSLNKGTEVMENNPLPPLKANVDAPTPSSKKKKVDSSGIPKYGVESLGDSSADTDAFRPTTPGNSPGVGHRKFAVEDKDMKVKVVVVHSPDVKAYVTEGATNGFKPTNPSHSPGVGHAQQNKIGQ